MFGDMGARSEEPARTREATAAPSNTATMVSPTTAIGSTATPVSTGQRQGAITIRHPTRRSFRWIAAVPGFSPGRSAGKLDRYAAVLDEHGVDRERLLGRRVQRVAREEVEA